MKLFTFNKGTMEWMDGIVRSTRWVVQLNRNPSRYFHLQLYIGQEVTSSSNGDWVHGYGYYAASITTRAYMRAEKPMKWGRAHNYYDGPHDSFGLGRILFQWQPERCKECEK